MTSLPYQSDEGLGELMIATSRDPDLLQLAWRSPDEGVQVRRGIQATCALLGRCSAETVASSTAIRATLGRLDAAIGRLTATEVPASEHYGLAGLPILAAVKSVRGIAATIVEQQTGTTLDEWARFVGSTLESLAEYEALLTGLAETCTTASEGDGDVDDALGDLVEETLRRTTGWRVLLANVARLSGIVDAITDSMHTVLQEGDSVELEVPERSTWVGRVKSTVDRTLAQSAGPATKMRDILLRPFVTMATDMRSIPQRTTDLGAQVQQLELALDLTRTMLDARRGLVTEEQAHLAVVRTAAMAELPELLGALDAVSAERARTVGFLARLDAAASDGTTDADTEAELRAFYTDAIADADARLADLTTLARDWFDTATRCISESLAAADRRLRLLDARATIEQTTALDERRRLLRHEVARLRELEQTVMSAAR